MCSLPHHRGYLALSFAAPLYFGLITLHYVFSHEFIVQDDMRQHVVWFQQFIDSSVFQGDAIAHYFRSVAPLGFTSVYRLGAWMGLEPLLLAKLLPLPMALVTTGFIFYTTLAIAPNPLTAWLTTLILNQQLWLNDDLVSATPRAFVYPLFSAFLYFCVQRSLWPMLLAIALLGLFFPQMMLIAIILLLIQLSCWERGKLSLTGDRKRWQAAGLGVMVGAVIVLPFLLNVSEYGAAVTAVEMRSLPEYGLGGRNEYFGVPPLEFILHGSSGIRIPIFPSIIWAGFALPWLIHRKCPKLPVITAQIRILVDLMVASLGLYFLAHGLLLRLHFPSRYLYHSWRFVLSIAAGIVLTAVIDQWKQWGRSHSQVSQKKRRTFLGVSALAGTILIGVPMFPPLMVAFQGWITGELPVIYTYLAEQPPKTTVASLAQEANSIPAFSLRSTWVGREFALPHHPNYYAMIHDRTSLLLEAQYSSRMTELVSLTADQDIDFFLIERSAFEPNYLQKDWLFHSKLQDQVSKIINDLQQGKQAAIAQYLSSCEAVSTEHYVLVNASCLTHFSSTLKAPEEN